MKMTLKASHKLGRDKNGNSILRIIPPHGLGFSIQTLGNLPGTHRDGITADTGAEVLAHVTAHGTDTQRAALGIARRKEKPLHYIQRRDGRNLETVDEFDTWKEARAMLTEYRMADPSAEFYLSSRPCKRWKD
jgi:hypothetical protein